MKGYTWLSDSWDQRLDDNEQTQLGFNFNVLVLGVAGSQSAFEKTFSDKTPMEQQKMAKDLLTVLPTAVKSFAKTALLMRDLEHFDSHSSDTVY